MQTFLSRFPHAEIAFPNVGPLVKQTKAILRIYRDLKWALVCRQLDLHEQLADAGWSSPGTGITYLTAFAPEIDLKIFETQVSSLLEDKQLLNFIDYAILCLGQYPGHGNTYFEIIRLQYLSRRCLCEQEILEKLCMERSTFYRRKKEALFLLGLCLFGFAPVFEGAPEFEQLSLFVKR